MSQRTWRIVTPEAVALDLDAAGLASRTLAALIDVLVFWMVLSALTTVFGTLAGVLNNAVDGVGETLLYVVVAFLFFFLLLGWPMAWEIATKGRSVGKMALGLRVVTIEGAPIRFRHAAVRGLVGLFELYLTAGTVALIVAFCSRRFRRLGDHLAGTVVVRQRSGTQPAVAIRFLPLPGWEQFALALDVSRLTSDHHRLIRAYLLRAESLQTGTRAAVGNKILDEVAVLAGLNAAQRESLTAHDPVQPLTAIAAAYQRRFSPDPTPYPQTQPYPLIQPYPPIQPYARSS